MERSHFSEGEDEFVFLRCFEIEVVRNDDLIEACDPFVDHSISRDSISLAGSESYDERKTNNAIDLFMTSVFDFVIV